MSNKENLVQTLSFYGRLTDEPTRGIIPFKSYRVSIRDNETAPLYKEDGYFVFSGVEQSETDYQFNIDAGLYQPRTIEKSLPSETAVELSFAGEDELYVIINDIQNGTETRVTFDTISFLKTIPAGAALYGENGFSTTLKETLEGEDIGFAILEDITGLSAGEVLRFVRSNNIVVRPGSAYAFASGTTILALRFSDDASLDKPPIAGVKCGILEVNDTAVNVTTVGGLDIVDVTIDGTRLILGSENDITVYSDARGGCVFYYPPDTAIVKLKLQIDTDGYGSLTEELTITPGGREFQSFELTQTH